MIADLRVALSVCYIALLLWRTDVATRGIPDNWWLYVLGFAVLSFALSGIERLAAWWQWRTAVRAIRALSPDQRRAHLQRIWLSGTRQQLTGLVDAEGTVATEGAIERFPFARGARRAILSVFWIAAGGSALLQVTVIARAAHTSSFLAWSLFAVSIVLALIAAWTRHRGQHMQTILEVGPFAVAELRADGTRRIIRWSQPLMLRARPRLRRLELSVMGQTDFIAIHYDRVGVLRALELILHRGRFELSTSDLGAPAA